jgi:T5SS/PEP-CTERM-associated repeat protein/autotransporter-associated beta strand protein
MNRSYRSIFNTALGAWIAAPETARAHGKGKNLVRAGAVAAVLACVAPTASAALEWIAGTGDWFTASNWQSDGFPTPGRYIDNGGTIQVQAPGANTTYFEIDTGTVTVDGAGTLDVGDSVDGTLRVALSGIGTLNITNGGTVTSAYTSIGGGIIGTGDGTLTVDGPGSTLTTGNLYVGWRGNATLNITNGGAVAVAGGTFVGIGAVSVDGKDSTLTTDALSVINTLSITNGGAVSSESALIIGTGGLATVTVDGKGSTWTNSGPFMVGYTAPGTLSITNGGVVNVNSGAGLLELGVTLETVDGVFPGSGTLNIGDGGSAGILNAAEVNGGTGTATLNFNHTDSPYYFTTDGTSSGTAINITGSTAVNHIGSGTTILTGTNTYTGGTTVEAGTLQSGAAGAFVSNTAYTVNGGTLDLNDFDLTMSSLSGAGGTVDLGSAILTVDQASDTSYAGAISGTGSLAKLGVGTLTLTGNSSYTGNTTVDGGTIAINNGNTVADKYGYIGTFAGSSGAVTVDGAGSSWSNSSNLYVGASGSGTLNITNGGAVSSNNNGFIGYGTGSIGTATVDGAGSIWINNNCSLLVGYDGTGTLNITNGGAVSDLEGWIGANSGSSGTVTVDGVGSSWTNSVGLVVGESGSGTLDIINGGSVTSLSGVIGYNSGGSGTATVDGTGSSWNNSNLTVGYNGSGTLAITNGGAVSDGTGFIGYESTGSGTVTVEGAGSTWTNGNILYVGHSGSGTLDIINGGTVSASDGWIGHNAGSDGTVTVDGTGSTWINSYFLVVGYDGSGTLNITGGGVVSDTYGILGLDAGSNGTVTVDGAGSSWINDDYLVVGNDGSGTLDITNGGAVSNTIGVLGNNSGSGTATVDGTGSSWTNSSNLVVGWSGSGTLDITNGGAVNVAGGAGTATLGFDIGSSGTLNIGDGGAAGILNAATVDGGAGTATLNFNHNDSAYYFTNDGTSGGSAVLISGSTAVNQIGSGTTILTGANTYTGDTNIDAGTLLVNGSITGDTFVNSGGTLGGSGSLGNVTVNSGGTLSPGNSPGILTVNGDLTLNSGATTLMQIDGPTLGTQYDHIDVTGTATLDGTLDLQFSYVPTAGSTYNLINAGSFVLAGDPNNGFNPITDNLSSNLGAALQVTPVISATEYDILIQQLSFLAVAGPLTPNQQSVATNLDSFSTSGNGATLFGALNMLSAGELPGAFGSLSGVQQTHTLPQVARVSRQFMHVLGNRLSWEPSETSMTANGFDNAKLAYNGDNIASLFGAPVKTRPSSNVWARAMGGFGAIDSDGSAPGADYNSSGLALGYDREVREGLLAGVAFGFTRSNLDPAAGSTDIDSYQLAAYGRKQWADTYLDATLGIGHHAADSRRLVQFNGFSEVAKADYSIDHAGLSLEAGKHYALSANSRVTPFAGLEYGHYRQNGFTETGAGDANLTYGDDSMDSLRSVLGARMNSVLTSSDGTQFDTTVGLSWAHEFLDREASLNPAFAVNGNVPFSVKGPVTDRDRAVATLGVSARLSKTAQLDLDYSGEFAESDRQHAFSATFRMKW